MTPVSRRVMNLAYMMRKTARRYPDMIALVVGDHQTSWSELDARIDACAVLLVEYGIGKGDRVVLQSRNSRQLIEVMFACFRIGAVWVPTNFRQSPSEVACLARSSGAKLLVCESIFFQHAAACALPFTIFIDSVGDDDYDVLISKRLGQSVLEADVDYDDACWFFYTSGTTGRPKAAVLTHGQMAFVINSHLVDLFPGTTELDTSLVIAPLTHGAGVHFLAQVARSVKTVIPGGDKFDPDDIWTLIERWRVTNFFAVPTILKMLIEHKACAERNHSSLRYVIYAGAPMYRVDQQRALKSLGPVIVQYFGLGEVTGAITVLRPSDHDARDLDSVKIGTCGRERTGMQISIRDDSGAEQPAGSTGEICVCGPAVFLGYHENDEANAKSFRDGWFRTGDLGHLDEEGDLFITGRASDMYISGGSNIYPREIEEKILLHDAIDEVAIVGMPDPVWGEVGVAVCVRRSGKSLDDQELLAWLKERVASYKMPRRILFWEALPKSAYGKITKALVKAEISNREG